MYVEQVDHPTSVLGVGVTVPGWLEPTLTVFLVLVSALFAAIDRSAAPAAERAAALTTDANEWITTSMTCATWAIT